MEIKTARNWYWYLWLSPLLTLPTLRFVIDEYYLPDAGDYIIAVLISALWHLILLIPATNESKNFVRWHGRQALLLAAMRTAIPIFLILQDEDYGILIAIPFVFIVYLIGNLIGHLQAGQGYCTLWRWFGKKEPILSPEAKSGQSRETKPIVKRDPDDLVEIIRFSTDPAKKQAALQQLNQLGLVENMDGSLDPAIPPEKIPGTPPTEEKKETTWWGANWGWVVLFLVIAVAIFPLCGGIDLLGSSNRYRPTPYQLPPTYTPGPTWTPSPTKDPDQMIDQELYDKGFHYLYLREMEDALIYFDLLQEKYPDYVIPAHTLNNMCWFGSLDGFAEDVYDYCENAVAGLPENGDIRDSRGLARALLGDYPGAIEDFRYYVDWNREKGGNQDYIDQRLEWIIDLEHGVNPFDETTLNKLRLE